MNFYDELRDSLRRDLLEMTRDSFPIAYAGIGAPVRTTTPIRIPPCIGSLDSNAHRWVSGGESGSSPPVVCGDCFVDLEDLPDEDDDGAVQV